MIVVKCVAFDADHTLYSINPHPGYDKKFEFLSEMTGLGEGKIRKTWLGIVDEVKNSRDPVKRSRQYSTGLALKKLGVVNKEKRKELVAKALETFWDNVQIRRNSFARQTIQKLNQEDVLTVAVVSDEYREHLLQKLCKARIPPVDMTICPEDTGEMKPSIKFYEKLLELTKLKPPEILMVGDSWERDLKVARERGLKTALYRKQEGNPHFFIDSLDEILSIVEGKTVLPSFFKKWDIRAKQSELDEKAAERLGKALGSLSYHPRVVVGRDNKEASQRIENAFVNGLASAGARAFRVGVGPTDFVSFSSAGLEADYGTMITASHLPPEYNGFKFLYGKGNGFLNPDLASVKKRYMRKDFRSGHGRDMEEEQLNAYLEHAERTVKEFFSFVDSRVIIDHAGGTAGHTVLPLLEKLGAEVIEIHKKRPLDCSKPENLSYLPSQIKKQKADLAVAFDTDADRLAVFDREGEWVTGDQLFCLADQLITGKDDKVVASVDTSRMLEESTKGEVVYTPIGDPFVISTALKEKAVLAGEPNGHYCFPSFVNYNSGTFFSALFTGIGGKIHEKKKELPRFFVERKEIEVLHPQAEMQRIKREVGREYEVLSLLDGIKFAHGDATVLLRASGTSDLIRCIVESEEEDLASQVSEEILGLVTQTS